MKIFFYLGIINIKKINQEILYCLIISIIKEKYFILNSNLLLIDIMNKFFKWKENRIDFKVFLYQLIEGKKMWSDYFILLSN
jgi:hypothetical protein